MTIARRTFLLAFPVAAAGCSLVKPSAPPEPPAREVAVALTVSGRLLRFKADRPDQLLSDRPLSGLLAGDRLVGMDFRSTNDTLYALAGSGRLYTVDLDTAAARPVGAAPATPLRGAVFGVDFNPVVDRLRVMSDAGQNLRLHPDTGALLASDPEPRFAPGDPNAARTPRIVAAAYTYNKANPKLTTNYALETSTGTLVTQGTREGVEPAVSPNTGQIFTVGPLGVGSFSDAAFDIHVLTDRAFAALSTRDGRQSRWVRIDLATGAARVIGEVAAGEPLTAMAFESW